MNNQIKKPKKSYFPKRSRKRRQECCGNCAECIKIGLCITRFRCTRFLKVESLVETRCRKSWHQFKRHDSQSLRCVMRVSGKRKDHRLEKYKSNLNISEVPTLWNLRTGPKREFVVDSGGSMHMVSKKDLNSAELEIMRTSRSPTTVMTANGANQRRSGRYVRELDLFVTFMILEETPAVLSLVKLCEDHGYTHQLDQRSKTTSNQKWQKDWLQHV